MTALIVVGCIVGYSLGAGVMAAIWHRNQYLRERWAWGRDPLCLLFWPVFLLIAPTIVGIWWASRPRKPKVPQAIAIELPDPEQVTRNEYEAAVTSKYGFTPSHRRVHQSEPDLSEQYKAARDQLHGHGLREDSPWEPYDGAARDAHDAHDLRTVIPLRGEDG